jgi:hypothetical protein
MEQQWSKINVYQEISFIFSEQIDETLPLKVQFELYESKVAYLQNILQQAMKDINLNRIEFCESDILYIKNSIAATKNHQRNCVRKIVFSAFTQKLEGEANAS